MSSSISNSDTEQHTLTWRTFFRRAAIFLVVLYAVLWSTDVFYRWAFSRGTFYKQQWVNSFKGQTFDLAILGSSRSLTTIDMQRLTDETKLSAVNLSLDGSGPADQLCLLKIFLEDHSNHIERVLLQVDHWALSSPGNVEGSYRLFLPFRDRRSVSKTLQAAYPNSGRVYRLRDRVPMLSFGRCNAYWSLDKLANSLWSFQRPAFGQYGSYLIDRSFPEGKPTKSFVDEQSDPDFEIVDQILQVCESRGIEVLAFTAPWFERCDAGGWEKTREKLAARVLDYRDFGDLYRGKRSHFYDLSHLNKHGAYAFTNELTQFIQTTGVE